MSPTPPLSITYTTTVAPDQIDELGHMNVRWYGHSARAATAELCERLGLGSPAILSAYTRHHHEQMEGNDLEVRSGLLGGSGRLRLYHELRNRANGDLAATFVYQLDHSAVDAPVIEIPEYGKPRTLDLDIDRLANPPTIDELRDRGLATRIGRQVTTDDQHPNDLFWGGERPDGETSWIHETVDGDRVASATMESRIWMHFFPTIGTRIQSFVANIDVGDKITHELGWVYDIDSSDVIAAFEGVDLAFSINQRRSVVTPTEVRERELARHHPDLA